MKNEQSFSCVWKCNTIFTSIGGALVLSSFVLFGCVDWVGDDDAIADPVEVIPGGYSATYELHESDCDPSFEDVKNTLEGWPPKSQPVSVFRIDHPDDQPRRAVYDMSHMTLRAGTGVGFWKELNWDRTLQNDESIEFVYPEQDFDYDRCKNNWRGFAPLRSDISVSAPKTGQIVMEVSSEWGDPYEECTDVDLEQRDLFIPTEACSESYRIVYELEEACMPIDECMVERGARSESGPGRFRYEPMRHSCLCESSDNSWDIEDPKE